MTKVRMRRGVAAVSGMLAVLSVPAGADAHQARPKVTKVYCDPSAQADQGCPEGEFVALRGKGLASGTTGAGPRKS